MIAPPTPAPRPWGFEIVNPRLPGTPAGLVLSGEAGAGKTTAAAWLKAVCGMERLSFATRLRDEVAAALYPSPSADLDAIRNWNLQQAIVRNDRDAFLAASHDPALKQHFRPLLQAWGAFRRFEDPLYWVNRLKTDLISIRTQYWLEQGIIAHFVIDDARYDNERDMLLDDGFLLVRIERPGLPPLPPDQAVHESERDWRRWEADVVLVNSGTRSDLEQTLNALAETLYPRK